ncbi:MAG: hypothetical protein ACRD2J_12945, partial [Thermoanaerobaculia bacterium]
GALTTVSRERLWRELRLALAEPRPAEAVEALAAAGALDVLVGPPRAGDARRRCLEEGARLAAADASLDAELLFLGAVLGEPRARLDGSGLDAERIRRLGALAGAAERRERVRDAGSDEERMRALDDAPPELLALVGLDAELADAVAAQRRYRDAPLPFGALDLGAGEGPHVGDALRAARRALALGTLDPADALSFARQQAKEYLRQRKGK